MLAQSLPQSWKWGKLGDMAEFINGYAFKPSDWGNEGLPIIRIQNLTGTQDVFNKTTKRVPDKYLVRNGDLLVSWSASLGVYVWQGSNALLNQHIFKAIPSAETDKEYLYYAIQHALDLLKARTHGSTMLHIKKGDPGAPALDKRDRTSKSLSRSRARRVDLLRRPRPPCGPANTAGPQWLDASRGSATADYAPSLRSPWRAAFEDTAIPHPPISEQRRIVDILKRADGIRRLRKQAIQTTRELIPVLFVDMFGDPATNPKGWPVHQLGDLLADVSYGCSTKADADAQSGIPILRMGNVLTDGRLDLSDLKYVALSSDDRQKYALEKGDILFNRTNSKDLAGCAGPQYGATGLPSPSRALRARRVFCLRLRLRQAAAALRSGTHRRPTMALRLARLGYRGLRALASLSLARSVGKTGLWDGHFEAVAASYFIRVRVNHECLVSAYLLAYMNTRLMKQRLFETARGAIGQANINAKELKSFTLPLPPVELQRKFETRLTQVAGIDVQQFSAEKASETTFQSLLHRAFHGEL